MTWYALGVTVKLHGLPVLRGLETLEMSSLYFDSEYFCILAFIFVFYFVFYVYMVPGFDYIFPLRVFGREITHILLKRFHSLVVSVMFFELRFRCE